MMTSSNGNFFRATGPLCGEFTGHDEFPAQRPVTRDFDVVFDLRPDKQLSKHSWGWWFETPSRPLWRHCNDVDLSTWEHFPHNLTSVRRFHRLGVRATQRTSWAELWLFLDVRTRAASWMIGKLTGKNFHPWGISAAVSYWWVCQISGRL